MNKILLYITVILLCSCDNAKKLSNEDNFKKLPKNNSQKINVDKMLMNELNDIPYDTLPFKLNKKLFKVFQKSFSDQSIIERLISKEKLRYFKECPKSINYLDSLSLNSHNIWLSEGTYPLNKKRKNKFAIKPCKFIKKFQTINGFDILLAHGSINALDFLYLLTKNKTGIIDYHIVSLLGGPFDSYFENGLIISEKSNIEYLWYLWYEDYPSSNYGKLSVLADGKFKIIYESTFDISTKKEFHDYKNDFEEREIPKITKEEKATLFKDFIKAIPEVSLPYNSKDFYSVMQIGSPEIGKPDITLLHHNKLSLDPNVKYFFSNSANDTAFKVSKNDYKEDYYFYPVAKFPIANENMAILYVYQSFCNYNPAIYVQLNTYDSNGNILATKILDRRFYNGVYRFLSSIQIEKDLKINSKQFIQNYEDYEYGDESYKEKAPEINEITYQIKANGFIE